MSNEQLKELIANKVFDKMDKNKTQFTEAKQVMTPLSTQIGVWVTLEVLEELGLLKLPN